MPLWCVLNAGGIQNFPALPGIEAVWVAVDHDKSGTGKNSPRGSTRLRLSI